MRLSGVSLLVASLCLVLGMLVLRLVSDEPPRVEVESEPPPPSAVQPTTATAHLGKTSGSDEAGLGAGGSTSLVAPSPQSHQGVHGDSTVKAQDAQSPDAGSTPATSTITEAELLEALSDSPWPESLHDRVVEIAKCESTLRPGAVGDGGLAHGLLQVRTDYHPFLATLDLFDVDVNLLAGWVVWWRAGQSLKPWSCADAV